ncbi:MAG TPA: 30S ribosomal protein S6 [Spirochaetota bacterium]|nr:30S ribosomal protein S6 [Spirochaetota bacterium]
MQKYEMMVIYDTDEKPLQEIKDFVKETFSTNNIKVVEEKEWGNRDLAYLINKKKRGFYTLFNFEAPESSIVEMNKSFGLYKAIMRNLVIRRD